MSRSRLLLALALVVVLLFGALLLRGLGPDPSANESASGASSSNESGDSGESGGTGGSGESDEGDGGSEGSESSDQSDASGSSSGEDGRASELAPVDQAQETAGKSKGGLPGLVEPDTSPLVRVPLPRTASRQGAIVAGYPGKALPVPPGAQVKSSSVSSSGRVLQVALEAHSDNSADAVARFHRVNLARKGFKEAPVPAVGGSTGIAFRRGADTLVLTLTPTGKRACDYTVFGTLHAARA